MKINYDKKGLKQIGLVFILCVLINMYIKQNCSPYIIPFTIPVFAPYIVITVLAFLYYFIKNREFYIFSDSRSLILAVLLEYMLISGSTTPQ